MTNRLLPLSIAGVLGVASADDAPLDVDPAINCTDESCTSDEGLLFVLRTRSYDRPKTEGTGKRSTSNTLQPDRRVTVTRERPGEASASGRFSITLPNGGVIWATEDPNLGEPELSVAAPSVVPFDGRGIVGPVRFAVRSNYPSFIQRLEVTLYRATDRDLIEPVARFPATVSAVSQNEWDGGLPASAGFRAGDVLSYVLRAYGADGSFDETYPQEIQLVTPAEATRGYQQLRDASERSLGSALTTEDAQARSLLYSVFAQNALRRQNIPVHGSRIRIRGSNLPADRQLAINGQPYPVDSERNFVTEYLEPVGKHGYDIGLRGGGATEQALRLDVDVTGRYFFGVGIADATVMQNDIGGSRAAFAGDDRAGDDWLYDGRVAFYLKAKAYGKYLITAQADTTEGDINHLFDDFGTARPEDIFRHLDPDLYYPTYGDDSTTYRDVDTMSKFYLRVDWDKSEALWGNYSTGFTQTEYAQYVRSLYGAALNWSSRGNNEWGDSKSELRLFGSEAASAPGHNEFIGTGGSLYYLRNTDILPGSDIVVVEIRDPSTGRVENRISLSRGADYEIDTLQGRILLTRPLSQITRENSPSLTRDTPFGGFEQRLIVDYEFVPTGFDNDNVVAGVRGRQWFGDHVAVGGTYVDEDRAGEDYTVAGGDLTLQAGRGTYLRSEYVTTEAFGAPIFVSENGGFDFLRTNNTLGHHEGDLWSVEGKANLKELGWTAQDSSFGGWWRDSTSGYSTNLYDSNRPLSEYGAEVLSQLTPEVGVYARYSNTESGPDSLTQEQATMSWRVAAADTLSAEVRRVQEDRVIASDDSIGLLGAVKYQHRFGTSLDLYGIAQVTLDDDDGRYADNDALVVGGQYLFGDQSTVGGEFSSGDRGNAATLSGEYRLNPMHSLYGGYTYSTDTTAYDSLFNPNRQNGWTLGQRWHLTDKTNLYSEAQALKEPSQSGLAHTFGMDFYPSRAWNLGFALQSGHLTDLIGEDIRRQAVSVGAGVTTANLDWRSKVEWRDDSGRLDRTQWVTTNLLTYRISDSWRLAGRLNFSDTAADPIEAAGARFVEGNVGFAWRPWNSTRWGLFGRYTYLYDLATLGQDGGAQVDQRSYIPSLEGVFKYDVHWEFALKLARREGEVRLGRDAGPWFDSAANFAAIQARYDLFSQWHALLEYRWLEVKDGGNKQGALIGVDRDFGKNFRFGIGYNFTEFSDDLTDFDYDHRGFFINGTSRF